MCYLVVERYSICRCLYYKHDVDRCREYRAKGHPIQKRTVLVGYACERHNEYQKETLLWSGGSDSTARQTHRGDGSEQILSGRQGIKITSAVALRALEEAQYGEEDDDLSSERPDKSFIETGSTNTTVEDNLHNEAKPQSVLNHRSDLVDLLSRLRCPSKYIASLQELEKRAWANSSISMYKPWNSNRFSSNLYKKSFGIEDYIPYPLIPSELQDVIPNRLSDDLFANDPTNTSDEEITAICQLGAVHPSSSHLNAIRMCRNVILRTFLNLKLLQQLNFCAGSFSIIILDKRRLNVAIILPIEMTDFIALVYELEYILRDSASLVLNTSRSKIPPNIDSRFDFLNTAMVKKYCQSLLQIDLGSLSILSLGVVCSFSAFLYPAPNILHVLGGTCRIPKLRC
jgi:hypothetical protein